ncbi:MAG: hypothetical protein DI498_09970 [Paracoccus denitrificans]|nr:MAG: hypothetical protein DI498_09970 [Paracoccus denitrificans]PZO83921.1 MAG: hypothetical protein DI633_09970 [Paracoccus denitrificans]
MHIMHVALGGCIKQSPVFYGLTQDTGGHIAYILGAAKAQASRPDVARVDIVTRRFDEPALGPEYAIPDQKIGPKLCIRRLSSASNRYLTKEALADELPSLTGAFLQMLARMPRRPDVTHCHFSDAAALGLAARERFGIPMIYTPHSLGLDKANCDSVGGDAGATAAIAGEPVSPARLRQERAAIRGADAIIASSRDEAERQVAAYDPASSGRVWRINPGIILPDAPHDGAAKKLLAATLDHPERPFILAIARPVQKKNLISLMRAYRQSADLQAKANLVILAGQGGDEAEQTAVRLALRQMADLIPGKICLPPRHAPSLVPQLYRQAAAQGGVFVNPALHEPFGLTLIEAARFGLPVVATRNGGPVDIIGAIGHGVLIDPLDLDAIAAACTGIVSDPAQWQRYAANAARHHHAFDWNSWADQVMTVCHRVKRRFATSRPQPLAQTLLAFDIDGTLTGCRPSAANFGRWVAGTGARGQHWFVATGRSLPEARRVLAAWDLPEPSVMITSVGTEIWRAGRRGAFVPCDDFADWLDDGWDAARVTRAITQAIAGTDVTWQAPYEQRAWKLSLSGTAAEAARVVSRIDLAALNARAIISHGRFVDIVPARAGKMNAILFEARRLGLSAGDCVTAGDSGNDLCMLDGAGRAIIVGNALEELRPRTRDGLYRAQGAHAAGVMEGLARFGLSDAVSCPPELIAAE